MRQSENSIMPREARMSRYDSHGKSYSRAYSIWRNMVSRCAYPSHSAYPRYGGSGIRVCKRWRRFQGFYEDMGDPPKGHTIDRLDNSLGYFKENCRWATVKEQNNNYSRCHFFDFQGQRFTIMQLSEKYHVPYNRLRRRLIQQKKDVAISLIELLSERAV